MDTISKIAEALASFDSPVSPSTDPARWLEANRDQILHIRDDSCAVFFDDQGSPYAEFSSTTVIYPVSCSAECESLERVTSVSPQRLLAYTIAHRKLSCQSATGKYPVSYSLECESTIYILSLQPIRASSDIACPTSWDDRFVSSKWHSVAADFRCSALVSLIDRQNKWLAFDDITRLIHHRSISESLWQYLGKYEDVNKKSSVIDFRP